MATHLDIIDRLEQEATKMVDDLIATTSQSSESILTYAEDFIAELAKNSDGTIKSSVENLKTINKFRSNVSNHISNTAYGVQSEVFTSGYADLVPLMDSYFASMNLEVGRRAVLDQIWKSNVESTIEGLVGTGLESTYVEPLVNIMRDAVTSGSDRLALKNALKEYIVTNEKLSKYATQISTDAVNQYTARYMEQVSSDLAMEYWYYKGTKISDSRSFCQKYAGYYFTSTRLREVVSTETAKGWGGMIPGTNWSNFKVYRGGYNCRHYLLPVSKAIYDASTKKY